MENLSKKQILIIGVIAVIIVVVVVYYFFNSIQEISYEDLDSIESEELYEDDIKSSIREVVEENIIVHIAGAVNNEGIVTLKEGERVIDAINQAGGLQEDADLTNVNLAYQVSDGQKIYIPHVGEEENENSENGEDMIVGSLNENSQSSSLVNINTATVTELTDLPGIGEQTAQKIVNYRKENGKFNSIEDIKNVSGIGDAKYNSIKDYITVK